MSNVPKLRFKEFSHDKSFANNCGEWEEKKLKTMSIKIGSGSTPRGGEQVYKTSGIPFIRSQNVNHNKLIFNDVTYIDEQTHISMKNSAVKANDILLNITGASIGRSCVVPKDFIEGNVNQHVCIIRLKDNYNPSFIQAFLASHNGEKLIYQGQTGSGREGINFQSIGGFKLNIPSKQEQEKIASFLTSVDTKIEQLTKKEQLLSSYKKGVMQKIFSGEIRFKADDGSEFCEWEEKKLGNLCSITTGKLDANAMVENGQYRFYTCAKDYFLIDNYAFDTDALLISGNGANVGYIHHYNGKFNAYQRTYVLDGFKDNIFFLKYVLDKYLYKRIMKEKNEGNTPYIVMGTLADMFINIPCLSEQTKIANFLSSIDSKIKQVQKQLDSTKEFKKALLQQMFV